MGKIVRLLVVALMAGLVPVTASADEAPQEVVTHRAVLFVVDVSGSMAGTRLEQAKSALRTSFDALPDADLAGLRSYAGTCSNGGTLRVPLGLDNRQALGEQTDALRASGGTPTPAALLAAAGDFPTEVEEKVVVLISDGQSTCGDPCPTAEQIAADDDIAFTAFTVGFNVAGTAESELACIADRTGGRYFSATDEEGLRDAIRDSLGGGYGYVAIGDSTTTGFSIPTCEEDRALSEIGCLGEPPATPYPERVVGEVAPVGPLVRKGIWGDTIRRSLAAYDSGENAPGQPWEPQLIAAEQAQRLVTVSIGANDLEWSDVRTFLSECITTRTQPFFDRVRLPRTPTVDDDACATYVEGLYDEVDDGVREVMDILETPRDAGAQVVIVQYYNPYNRTRHVPRPGPIPDGERSCAMLHAIAGIVVDTLNDGLERHARTAGFDVVDLRPVFDGHGAGSQEPFVFGADCEVRGLIGAVNSDVGVRPRRANVDVDEDEVAKRFDPHPNGDGTRAQADAIVEVLR